MSLSYSGWDRRFDDWARWWRCPGCLTPNPGNQEACAHCHTFVPRGDR